MHYSTFTNECSFTVGTQTKKMSRSGLTKNKGAKRQDKARFVFFPQLAVRQ